MTRTIGTALASLMISTGASIAWADAPNWAQGIPGGPDVVLSMTSIGEADRAMRELVRAAPIDWLPSANRLLSVTNLSPGADTGRPISIGFVRDAEAATTRFVAVIPSERPTMLAANFDALPSADHAGLFEFAFAGMDYFARALPDDHLAISNSAALLTGLREQDAEPLTAPVRLTLAGDDSIAVLADLLGRAGQRNAAQTESLDGSVPDEVESIRIDFVPSGESLRAELRIRARTGTELAQSWRSGDATLTGPLPFPETPELLVAQGSAADPAVGRWLGSIGEQLLGLNVEQLDGVRSMAILVVQPENLTGFGDLKAAIALEADDPERVRAAIADGINSRSGSRLISNASTRGGVTLDRFQITAEVPARSGGSGWQQWLPGSRGAANGPAVQGWMFVRDGRLYITNTDEANGLDRLIAYGPEMRSIEDKDSLQGWLAQLPDDASARGSLNLETIMSFVSKQWSIPMPEDLGPLVASMRSGDSEMHATVIIPARALGFMDRVRARIGERRATE